MSGILAFPVDAPARPDDPVLSGMLARLRHLGPDGADVLLESRYVLAHSHFWTTPEEVGERQPVVDPETGHSLVLDGRIDNRLDLGNALGGVAPSLSDARLLLKAYGRWGNGCFGRVLGSFAVVLRDGRTGAVVAARDPMGDRALYYSAVPGGVAVASEVNALLAHPSVPSDLDEESLARYFAIEAPRAGSTFFRAVRELPAGSILHATAVPARVETYWTPAPPEPIRYRRDEEYAEHLATVLGDAVEARLRSSTRVGISLSGGMDSPSVAALAVERLKRQGGAPPLVSFSWVFDEQPECDERCWIEPLVSHLGLEATYVAADPHWPLRDADTWPVDPSSPFSNPYERLHQALWSAASGLGVRTVLVGSFSDRLFAGRESWLAARVGRGHWVDLFAHLASLAGGGSALLPWRDPALRALLGQVVPRRSRRGSGASRPPWLTPQAWALAEGGLSGSSAPPAGIPERRAASVFNDRSRMRGGAGFPISRAPVELRDPFRDLRVVRFMLAVPPDQLWRESARKFILQRAMRGRLPAAILGRTRKTPLDPFFRKQLFGQEAATLEALLRAPDALWRGRIEEKWLLGGFPERFRHLPDGPGLLVPWFAAAAELWKLASEQGLYSGRIRIGYTPPRAGASDSAGTHGCEERDG